MRIFSWLGVAPSFSNVVGPVAAGLMIDGTGFAGAYLLLMALPLATLASARYVPVLPPPGVAPRDSRTAWDLLDLPGMKRLLTVNWLFSMCWDVHSFAVPILGHERGFNASTIGFVLGTFTLAVTGVRLLVPVLAHRIQEKRVLAGAMLGSCGVFTLYPFAHSPWQMAGCAALLGLTLGVAQPLIMTTLHHLTPEGRHGESLAFRSMAINASSTLMPLVFGLLGSAVGAAALTLIVLPVPLLTGVSIKYSAATMLLLPVVLSSAVALTSTLLLPLVGFGTAARFSVVGPTLSMKKVTVAKMLQFNAASRPRT